jgi:Dolichyl-phosphate-mannose-protein mannosyltransferase
MQSEGHLSRANFLAQWLLPLFTLFFYIFTINGYGYHRDELYYMANGEHLGLGYVDHPPLIGFIAAFIRVALGESLFALRLLPALAAAATVWMASAIVREFGGNRFAQILAAITTMLPPVFLAVFSYLSMNSFDILIWAIGCWVLARILRTGNQRLWVLFGVVMGIGLQNKISVLFLGFGIVVGLLLSRRWEIILSPWLWIGGAIAVVIFVPHLLWQQMNGWPTLEFMEHARNEKMVTMPASDFLVEQLLQVGPISVIVWFSGLLFFLFDRRGRSYRTFGWAYLAILAVMMGTHAKPYYLAPAYTILFSGGAVAIETWTAARRAGVIIRGLVMALIVLGGTSTIPLAKPILPEDAYVRYAGFLGIQPSTDERHDLERLPQFFADMHGWPELAQTIVEVYKTLPLEDQNKVCIFGQNYGEAGAIDLFGPKLGLPKALSAHNSYYLWGPGNCTGEIMIVIDDDRETLQELFESVELGATFTCKDCMPYENNNPIWVVRRLKQPISQLWPRIKHYD